MDPRDEIRELERLWQNQTNAREFASLQRSSKWGERIREEVIAKIKRGEPAAIADGILFLEENPRYFRTGYFKGSIANKLKSVILSEMQREQLRNIILAAIDSRKVGPEFNEYARLAVVVANDAFLARLLELAVATESWSKRRVGRILSLCRSNS
jgi:hypothetical protein